MKKMTIIGHFAMGETTHNGQTVKTKIVTEELQNQLGAEQVLKIDTHGWWKALLKAPFQVFKALRKSQNVIIFPAHNGVRVYAPLLTFFRRFFKNRKLHYVVIGGWLPQFVEKRKGLKRRLERFDGIYVETSTMKMALEKQGFTNVHVMPNCKKLTVLKEDELVYAQKAPYKLCTFSRVTKEKGIEDAVQAVKAVNESLGCVVYTLDIYGQIDDGQAEWFDALQKQFPAYVRYCGCVDADKSVETLKEYFALLFPTYYEGEGFAGTLLDAYAAGVPVVASDWKYNIELVSERVGWTYPTNDQDAFIDVLKKVAESPDMLLGKKVLCLQEAKLYQPQMVIREFIKSAKV